MLISDFIKQLVTQYNFNQNQLMNGSCGTKMNKAFRQLAGPRAAIEPISFIYLIEAQRRCETKIGLIEH